MHKCNTAESDTSMSSSIASILLQGTVISIWNAWIATRTSKPISFESESMLKFLTSPTSHPLNETTAFLRRTFAWITSASCSLNDAKIADSETIKESSIISIFDDGITEVLLVDLFLTTSNPSFNPSPYVTSATRPQSVPLLDETALLRTFFCHMV